MKFNSLLLCIVFSSSLLLFSCGGDDDEDQDPMEETENTDNDDSSDNGDSTGDEDAAASGVLAPYDGTYNVSGERHTRGTVIISEKGTKIDFDNGVSYDIDDNNVFDRISAFNRYQIEFYDANNKQDRIRINLDPTDSSKVVGFDYDPGADEKDIISVTVTN